MKQIKNLLPNRHFHRRSLLSQSKRLFSESLRWRDAHLPIEEASTPPSIWYTGKEFYDKVEKEQTFRTWQIVGRADQVKNDGDYLAVTMADQPIIVIKQADGYKAFYNVCRHHAAQLCDEGTGSLGPQGRITCPYHGWQYTTDGRLAKAIKMKGCKNFQVKDFGLNSLPIEKFGPWLFVNLSKEGFQENLLSEQFDAKTVFEMLTNSHFESLQYIQSKSYILNCNWKVFIDNYLDGGYHVPIAHKALTTNLNLDQYQRYSIPPHTRFYLQTCPSKPIESAKESEQSRIRGNQTALYIFQYPNICINRYGKWMDTNIVYPLNERQCIVHFDWFVDSTIVHDTKLIKESIAASEVVQEEDVWLCQRVQKGLESQGYDVGRYAPMLEGKKKQNLLIT
jgi:choline monooxygenase